VSNSHTESRAPRVGDMISSIQFPKRRAMVQRIESTANGPVYHTALGWWLAHEVRVEALTDEEKSE
jgi:hypothetical protein